MIASKYEVFRNKFNKICSITMRNYQTLLRDIKGLTSFTEFCKIFRLNNTTIISPVGK